MPEANRPATPRQPSAASRQPASGVPAALAPLAETVRDAAEAAAPEATLRFRAMFGGATAYADDRPFASLSNVGLALKLAPADQDALLALPGASRLQYEPGAPVSRQYVVVPPALAADPDALAPWLRRSLDHVRAQPARRAGSPRG